MAAAFSSALHYKGSDSIFNIGSGAGLSLNELVTILSAELGRKLEVIYKPGRDFDVKSNVLCCKRAQQELQWQPRISMAAGLSRTLTWLGEHTPTPG